MKRKALLSALFLMIAASAGAQSPTTTYPYLYPTFIEGKVIMTGGKEEKREMNIHLRHDNLHFIDNGIIKSAFLTDVIAVGIGTDIFIPVDGQMLKVVAKNDHGVVAAEIIGDFAASTEAVGAYGIASTSSATMKLTSVQTDNQVNQNYMNILNEKSRGVELRVDTKYWLVSPDFRIRATKRVVEETLPEVKTPLWKSFLKTHKIKWKDPNSLLQVLDWLDAQ